MASVMTATQLDEAPSRADDGTLAAEPSTVHFPDGIPGFEACRRFVVLVSDAFVPLQRIDAVEGPPASFLCIDPRHVMPGYRCRLSAVDEQRLEVTPDSRLVWLSLVSVEPGGAITVNLRAPIVVNADRMLGCQVLPDDDRYPVRHVLVPEE